MWTSSVTINGTNAFIGSLTSKHKINLFCYPLSYTRQKKWIIVNITGIIMGPEENKKSSSRTSKPLKER